MLSVNGVPLEPTATESLFNIYDPFNASFGQLANLRQLNLPDNQLLALEQYRITRGIATVSHVPKEVVILLANQPYLLREGNTVHVGSSSAIHNGLTSVPLETVWAIRLCDYHYLRQFFMTYIPVTLPIL